MTAAPQSFTLIRWKQLYYLGAFLCIAVLCATAWDEAVADNNAWYYAGAAFLALCAPVPLIQFVCRILHLRVFALREEGVDIEGVGLVRWENMRRIQNFPRHCILFTFAKASENARVRKRNGGICEKTAIAAA